MKSVHNTRQDRPIVNATDDPSNALLCAHTLAQPVFAASVQVTTVCTRQSLKLQRKCLNEQLPLKSKSTINGFGRYDRYRPAEGKRPELNGF